MTMTRLPQRIVQALLHPRESFDMWRRYRRILREMREEGRA